MKRYSVESEDCCMKDKYQLRFLRTFYDDLEEIVLYISNRLENPAAAESLVNQIDVAISRRLSNPEAYEKFYSNKEREYPYYRIYVKNYVIYYVVITNTDQKIMEVRRILSARRNRQYL